MSGLISKAAALRFLKKTVLFCIGYIVIYSIAMIVIFCIKEDYPELLTTVTFAYFSVEIVVSAGIKIFETFRKRSKKNDHPACGTPPWRGIGYGGESDGDFTTDEGESKDENTRET